MNNNYYEKMLNPEECPVCGRKYVRAAEHIYKISTKRHIKEYVCSYTCMRKAQEMNPNRAAAKRDKRIKDELRGKYDHR